jgi:hypothetical protein
MPLLIHSQDNKASGYVVAYASTPEQAESIAKNPSWKILRNDSVCQAVSFDRKTVMAAFYEAGKSKLSSNLSISVDKPCLILITESAVYISDPGHTGGLFSLKINKSNFFVCLPSDGTTLKIR